MENELYNLLKDELDIENNILKECISYLLNLPIGKNISTNDLALQFEITKDQTIQLLAALVREEIYATKYGIYCPECKTNLSPVFDKIADINPENIKVCPNCSKQLFFETDPFQYLTLSIYRKA